MYPSPIGQKRSEIKLIELISGWAKNIVFVVIVLSILEMLLPQNKIKKYVKMIMGLFLLFQILSPLIQNKEQVSLANWEEIWEGNTLLTSSNTRQETDQTSMDNRLQQIYQEELEKDIVQKIEEKGYEVTSCQVKTKLNLTKQQEVSQKTNTGSDNGIEKIILGLKKAETNEEKSTNDKQTQKEQTKEEASTKSEKSTENKLIEEIQKIKKVEIGETKETQTKEGNQAKSEKNKTTLSQADIQNVKKFLIEEYEVKESCLKINGKN